MANKIGALSFGSKASKGIIPVRTRDVKT